MDINFHHYNHADAATDRKLDQLDRKLTAVISQLTKMETRIMAELDNLKAAVAQTLTDIADETGELKIVVDKLTALAGQTTIAPADVQAVADQLNAAHQGVVDAIAAAKAAVGG